MGYAITPFASGATNPTLTALLANLGVQLFDTIDLPYTDTTSLNALETFLSDASGRWAAETMPYGRVIPAHRGTFSHRTPFGLGWSQSAGSLRCGMSFMVRGWAEAAACSSARQGAEAPAGGRDRGIAIMKS